MSKPRLIASVPVATLVDPEMNPNVMEPEQYELLKQAIAREGFLQPVLVRDPLPGELPPDQETLARLGAAPWFRIVDGVHRVKAAREVGVVDIPIMVVDVDAQKAATLQIGMNKMRGELDLGAVANVLTELHDGGWSVPDLTLTGFTEAEINDLLKATSPDDVMTGPIAGPDDEPDTPTDGTFVLEVTFTSAKDMRKAKRALQRAAGKGRELGEGLLHLLGERE